MVSRKRAREETEESNVREFTEEPGLLERLRNMWEFANLMQFIYSFGKVIKIDDDFDIEDLETECLTPVPSEKLLDIGLALLKFVSSHRGLTSENFEEYARRQYNAKAPSQNPFGEEEEPKKFNEFDVFEKIRILQQLSVWTLWNPDRIRERMPEQKEMDQTQWRVEELGYDRDDRLYYVLDDNRLYRRTDPPIPPPKPAKPKANSKKARAAARAAKRRKLSESTSIKNEEDEERKEDVNGAVAEQDNLGGYKWECIAITLAQYQQFLNTIRKTKDPNEQILRDRLVELVLPVIEKAEETQQKKILRREKELINLQRLATAKRSSRIASRHERERQEIEAAEEARQREAKRIALLKEQEKQKKIERERLYRMMTREQRLKDREQKRIQHEEELARMEEEAEKAENGETRMSERQLKAEMEKRKKDLEALHDEEKWVFDCSICGIHGENLDDGSHSVACEKCNVWQHSKCLGIPQAEAEKDDFHFICADCKRRIEDAKRPKIPPLKFRIVTSSSPPLNSTTKASGNKRKRPDGKISPSIRKMKRPSGSPTQVGMSTLVSTMPEMPNVTNIHLPTPAYGQRLPPPRPNAHAVLNGINSPYRLPESVQNGIFGPPLGPAYSAYSSFKAATGSAQCALVQIARPNPVQNPKPDHQDHQTHTFLHYQPPTSLSCSNTASFNSQRPSSSQSVRSSFPSPVENRPSMSPTQGNRDVGPLAGFPPFTLSNGILPGTPLERHQPHTNAATTRSVSVSSTQSRPLSFSPATATTTARNTFAHTPPPPSQYSHGVPMSGLSPTKYSPVQPLPSTGVGVACILPPIQRLQPSPKLMGRASADSPVPPPVKSMTPEQEDRRRRENELLQNGRQEPLSLTPVVPPIQSPAPQQQHHPSVGVHLAQGLSTQ